MAVAVAVAVAMAMAMAMVGGQNSVAKIESAQGASWFAWVHVIGSFFEEHPLVPLPYSPDLTVAK